MVKYSAGTPVNVFRAREKAEKPSSPFRSPLLIAKKKAAPKSRKSTKKRRRRRPHGPIMKGVFQSKHLFLRNVQRIKKTTPVRGVSKFVASIRNAVS